MVTRAPIVLKIGGRALDGPAAPAELARAVADFDRPVVIVHGGGARVSEWCRRHGLAPLFHDGLRVTDAGTLEIAVAVLAGLANKQMVAALRHAGLDAVGLSGVDGGLLLAEPHPDAALGAVGTIRQVRRHLLDELLAAGRCPVVAPIAAAHGGLLNVNADDAAAAIAAALKAPALVLLSDVAGLRLEGRPVAALSGGAVEEALRRPDVTDGMRPKLRAARQALAGGAGAVYLGTWRGPATLADLAEGSWNGTLITRNEEEMAHRVDTVD